MPKKKNYDFLFDFYMKSYDDIIAHFMNLDEKIARYFSAYSIFVALTGIVSLTFKFVLNHTNQNDLIVAPNIILLIFLFVLLMLFIGWGYLFWALSGNLQRLPYDKSMMNVLSGNDSKIKYHLSERARQAIEHNVDAIEKKAKKIKIAFILFFPIMILFALGLLFAILNVFEAIPASAEQTQSCNCQSQPIQ